MLRRLYYLPVILTAILAPVAARAEGSKDLTSNNLGFRPFLEDGSSFSNGIPRTNIIQVYAEAGEIINLGSSAIGTGGGNIVATAPNGQRFNCITIGNGLISTRNEEENGTYTPCQIIVGTTVGDIGGTGNAGIWEIQFLAPASTYNAVTGAITRAANNNPNPVVVTADPPAAGAGNTFIAAWDVTVTDGGVDQDGRVFANYLALNPGFAGGLPEVNSTAFIQTENGYLYSVDLNGMEPAGFLFFANEDGFTNATGAPKYQSVEAPPANLVSDTSSDPIIADPSDATNDAQTHKIFFNDPNSSGDLPLSSTSNSRGTTWLLNPPENPPSPTALTFFGKEGTENQTGTNPLEGSFFFNATASDITFSVAIDINDDGDYTDAIDRVLFGRTVAGENQVIWDGTDGLGNDVPPSEVGYTAEARFFTGEVHFPFIDVERNINGLELVRQTPLPFTPPAGDPIYDNDWVYYDDSAVTSSTGTNGQPNPLTVLNGVNSTGGTHGFGAAGVNWGDQLGIDTWVLVPSIPTQLSGRIFVLQADLDIAKALTTTTLIAGGEISYQITVTNNGPSNLTEDRAAGVTDSFPAQIVNPTWTCAITTGTGACAADSGSGDINTTVELESGAVATFTVTAGLASDATTPITNSATVTRPDDVTDPNDQDGSGGDNTTETSSTTFAGTIEPSNPVLGLAKAAGTVVNNNDGTFSIPYTFVVSNTGNVSFNNVQVTEDLSSTFGDSAFTIESLTSADLTVNDNFDGSSDTNLLVGTDSLDVDTSGTIVLTVQVTPGNDLPAYTNTAQVSGTTPGGDSFTDDSTDGSDPDADGDGDPTTDNDPTVVTFEVPRLGVAKAAGTPVNNNDGTYTIPYTVAIANTGNVEINNLQVSDDLTTTFSGVTFSIQSISSTDVTVNNSFDGTSDTSLLAGTDTLAVDATAQITFNVLITPGTNLGPFENTATANGTSPGGTDVSDDSTDGADPDADGDGDPTNDSDPTVVSLSESPSLGVAKSAGIATDNNDGTFTIPYTVRVNNNGDVPLSDLQVSDDLTTTFSGIPFSVQSISSDDLTVNNSFDGSSDTSLLAGTDTLAVDATAEITFNVLITPGTNEGPFDNTATANGTSPTGASVSDDSTDGADSDPDGDGDPTNDSDPTSVTISIAPPTPNLRLVKRVTRVNGTTFNSVIDDPNDANDDSSLNWPSGYLLGEIDVPDILPGDTVEYTIYFLSDGGAPANNVRICDRIPEEQTFADTAFNGLNQASGGFVGADRGSAIAFGTAAPQSYTNANDNDLAAFFSPGTQITSPPCSTANNSNGAVIWQLGNVTNFSDDANNSFGFVRFRATVD